MKRWTLRIASCLVLGCVTTVAVAWAFSPELRHDYIPARWRVTGEGPAAEREAWERVIAESWHLSESERPRLRDAGWAPAESESGMRPGFVGLYARSLELCVADMLFFREHAYSVNQNPVVPPFVGETPDTIDERIDHPEWLAGWMAYDVNYHDVAREVRSGWPMRSLRGCVVVRNAGHHRGSQSSQRHVSQVENAASLRFERALPFTARLVWVEPKYVAVARLSGRLLPTKPLWRGLLLDTLFWGVAWFALIPLTAVVYRRGRRAVDGLRLARAHKHGRCPTCNYDLRGNRGGDKGCSECGWGRPEEDT